MKTLLIAAALIVQCSSSLYAETIPLNGSKVHHTTIYFEENLVSRAVRYRLEVQEGKKFVDDKQPVFVVESSLPTFYVSGFKWETNYCWKIIPFDKRSKTLTTPPIHSFETLNPYKTVVNERTQLKINKNDTATHSGGMIALDCLRGIYNRAGTAQWILPVIEGHISPDSEIRDIKLTPENSLTLLADSRPIEINLAGRVIWSMPHPFVLNQDTLTFHHEFQKFGETYYLLANKTVLRPILTGYEPGKHKLTRDIVTLNGKYYVRVPVAVILQVDKNRKILWQWDATPYLNDVDLNHKTGPDNFPLMQSHSNGLGIDEKDEFIYLSFRDLGRIIRIEKKTGAVVNSFGQVYPSGEAKQAQNAFRQQHDGRPTKHGTFLVFNNNGPRETPGISSVMEFEQTTGRLLFKFTLDFDSLTIGRSGSGGNVNELPNNNLLVSAGQLNRLFELTREPKIVWDAFITAIPKGDSVWKPIPNYRCSWVKSLEQPGLLLGAISTNAKKNEVKIQFDYYNTGTRPDTLKLTLHEQNGAVIQEEPLDMIVHGQKKKFKKTIKTASVIPAGAYLKVWSVLNYSNVKIISLDFKQDLVK